MKRSIYIYISIYFTCILPRALLPLSRRWTVARPSVALAAPSRRRKTRQHADAGPHAILPCGGTALTSAVMSRYWTAACPSIAPTVPTRRWTVGHRLGSVTSSATPSRRWTAACPHCCPSHPVQEAEGNTVRCAVSIGHGRGPCRPVQEVDNDVLLHFLSRPV